MDPDTTAGSRWNWYWSSYSVPGHVLRGKWLHMVMERERCHQELEGLGPREFGCAMFLAEPEHEGPPGVESPFSPLSHPQGGIEASARGDLKVQSQPSWA